MNTTAICRLTWKEYRVQRQLWLAILILSPATQLLAKVITALSGEQHHPETYVVMAIVAVGVYLLGCGATLFATEHETGTFDFQRTLPVNARQVLVAKVGLTVVSAAALLWALVALTHLFFQAPVSAISWLSWQAGIVTLVEVLAWSIFFSLLLKQPLSAAVCAIFPPSLITCVIFPIAFDVVWHTYGDLMAYYRFSLPPRAAIAGLVLLFDIWLAHRWFHGTIGWPSWLRLRRGTERSVLPQPRSSLPTFTGQGQTGWDYLVWLTWRQGRWLILTAGGLCGWMLLAFATRTTHGLNDVLFVFPLVLGPILFGLAAFSFDQSAQQFRFFAERGVSSRWLWFVRHGVWIPLVLVMGSLVMLVESSANRNTPLDSFYSAGGWLVLTLTFYAVSQACALLFRSTLVAFVVAIFGAVMAQGWIMLVVFAGIPVWWAILPIPVVLLFATWLLAPDWIEERRGRRYWTKLAATLGAPALTILAACACFRAFEIKFVDPGFDVAEYTQPLTRAEQQTLKLYEEADRWIGSTFLDAEVAASSSLPTIERDALWLKKLSVALPPLKEAHRRESVPLGLAKLASTSSMPVAGAGLGQAESSTLLLLIRLKAEALERDSKLLEAWEHYEIGLEIIRRTRRRASLQLLRVVTENERDLLERIVRWSAHPQQSSDLLAIAETALHRHDEHESRTAYSTQAEYVATRSFLRGVSTELTGNPNADRNLARVFRWMPWERIRAERLLNHLFMELDLSTANSSRDRWVNTTLVPFPIRRYPFDEQSLLSRRVGRIRLSLLAWKKKTGAFPPTLRELSRPDEPDLFVDPTTRLSFGYFPEGLGVPVKLNDAERTVLPDHAPFLWSSGGSGFRVIDDGIKRFYFIGPNLEPIDDVRGVASGIVWRMDPNPGGP